MPGKTDLSVINCQLFYSTTQKNPKANIQNRRKRKGTDPLYLGIKVLLSSA